MPGLGWFGLAVGGGAALSPVACCWLRRHWLGRPSIWPPAFLTIMLGMALVTMFLTSAVFTFRDCFSPPDHERTLHVDDVTYDYK